MRASTTKIDALSRMAASADKLASDADGAVRCFARFRGESRLAQFWLS